MTSTSSILIALILHNHLVNMTLYLIECNFTLIFIQTDDQIKTVSTKIDINLPDVKYKTRSNNNKEK
jgi:hypothetical protein